MENFEDIKEKFRKLNERLDFIGRELDSLSREIKQGIARIEKVEKELKGGD